MNDTERLEAAKTITHVGFGSAVGFAMSFMIAPESGIVSGLFVWITGLLAVRRFS